MQFINVTTVVINGYQQPAVNARELWQKLASKQDFSTWIKNRLADFEKEIDFTVHKIVDGKNDGKFKPIEYTLTLDTAKHLAMLERNEHGKKIRQYFIEIEREYYKAKEEHAKACAPKACTVPTPINLTTSTTQLIDKINWQLISGKEVEPEILRYAWNIGRLVGQRKRIALVGCDDDYINRFMDTVPRGEQLNRNAVYGSYCDFCHSENCTPCSPRSFWPRANKCANLRTVRTSNARYIIIEL